MSFGYPYLNFKFQHTHSYENSNLQIKKVDSLKKFMQTQNFIALFMLFVK